MFEAGRFEYGLKTGDLSEKEIVKFFEKALNKVAAEINDSRIPKRRKLRKYTEPFGRSTPDTPEPEYDHIYIYLHSPSRLFLQLYPNQEKNGQIKFSEEGITWNLYVDILERYPFVIHEGEHIQEFSRRAMEELFRTLPCEKILIKKYIGDEDRL